jgi:alkylmercury lyase
MQTSLVKEIAKALREREIPPAFTPEEARLLLQVLGRVAEGQPVPLEEVARVVSTLQMPPDDGIALIRKVSELDPHDHVVGIFGLSQKSHPHRFMVDGRTFSTWCAWDTLFLPGLLKRPARVESVCPTTKSPIRAFVTPEAVEHVEPPDAVISIVVPRPTKKGRESVEEIWTTLCHFVHYFSSADAASDWFRGKGQDATLFSVADAHQVGRLAFQDLLTYG